MRWWNDTTHFYRWKAINWLRKSIAPHYCWGRFFMNSSAYIGMVRESRALRKSGGKLQKKSLRICGKLLAGGDVCEVGQTADTIFGLLSRHLVLHHIQHWWSPGVFVCFLKETIRMWKVIPIGPSSFKYRWNDSDSGVRFFPVPCFQDESRHIWWRARFKRKITICSNQEKRIEWIRLST